MSVQVAPLPLPPSADPSKFVDFGREVIGLDAGNLTPEQFKQVEELLYKVCETILRSDTRVLIASHHPIAQCPLVPQHLVIARAAIPIDQGTPRCAVFYTWTHRVAGIRPQL